MTRNKPRGVVVRSQRDPNRIVSSIGTVVPIRLELPAKSIGCRSTADAVPVGCRDSTTGIPPIK